MARYMEISLDKRQVSCVARLLDEKAPRTCEAVWSALPHSGEVYHAKYARNEIYALVPAFAPAEPPLEYPTITPIPGDVVYFTFQPWQLDPSSHGYGSEELSTSNGVLVDLAIFYGRNNLLLNPDFGFVPGSVYATIEEGLDRMAEACQDVWRAGGVGETLSYRRLEEA